jgi:hypothetical protein
MGRIDVIALLVVLTAALSIVFINGVSSSKYAPPKERSYNIGYSETLKLKENYGNN